MLLIGNGLSNAAHTPGEDIIPGCGGGKHCGEFYRMPAILISMPASNNPLTKIQVMAQHNLNLTCSITECYRS